MNVSDHRCRWCDLPMEEQRLCRMSPFDCRFCECGEEEEAQGPLPDPVQTPIRDPAMGEDEPVCHGLAGCGTYYCKRESGHWADCPVDAAYRRYLDTPKRRGIVRPPVTARKDITDEHMSLARELLGSEEAARYMLYGADVRAEWTMKLLDKILESTRICVVCGLSSPCMTEADLKPGDPGVPCTFERTPKELFDTLRADADFARMQALASAVEMDKARAERDAYNALVLAFADKLIEEGAIHYMRSAVGHELRALLTKEE